MNNKQLNLILFSLLILVFGFSSCQSQNADIAPTATPTAPMPASTIEATQSPTATATLAPTPGADEIRSAIVDALLALNDQANRMDVTTVLADGTISTNVIEFVPPDKKRIVSVEQNVEYIVAGDKVYSKTESTGEWEETQIPASTFMSDQVTAEKINETISDGKWVREDKLDGKNVVVYSYNSTTLSNDIELHSLTELWIGQDDGLPWKMVIDGETLSASTDPSTGASQLKAVKALTTTLIDFDPTISIEPPVLN